MSLSAWRLFKAKHRHTAFSGEGARLYGGRWNHPGTPVIYTAASTSLAVLEMLVHLDAHQLAEAYRISEVTFDRAHVEKLDEARLPRNWRTSPPPSALQQIGDDWVGSRSSLVLRVPSTLVESEANYLINPAHPSFPQLRFGKPRAFHFDPRLIKNRE